MKYCWPHWMMVSFGDYHCSEIEMSSAVKKASKKNRVKRENSECFYGLIISLTLEKKQLMLFCRDYLLVRKTSVSYMEEKMMV